MFKKISMLNRPENPFIHWPPAPAPEVLEPIRPLQDDIPALEIASGAGVFSFGPGTMIIAAGKTGERALIKLYDVLGHHGTAHHSKLKSLLISRQNPTTLPPPDATILRLALNENTIDIRRGLLDALHLPQNTGQFKVWLENSITSLTPPVQVFFIGSLEEEECGLWAELLNTLRASEGWARTATMPLRVTTLFTYAANTPTGKEAQVLAGFLESGRMSFNGPHIMSSPGTVVRRPLMDYLFFLQAFADAGGVLADTLFTLLQSTSDQVWMEFAQDMAEAGRIRESRHEPVFHTLGLSSLYIPVAEIRKYLAYRLARAVVFGERSAVSEGLIHRVGGAGAEPDVAQAVRQLLLHGKFSHPVFRWFVEAKSRADFNQLPRLSNQFDALFLLNLSHGLNDYLNKGNNVIHAKNALDWISLHIQDCLKWQSESSSALKENSAAFKDSLQAWQIGVKSLLADLNAWIGVLFDEEVQASHHVPVTGEGKKYSWRDKEPANSGNDAGVAVGQTQDTLAGIFGHAINDSLDKLSNLPAEEGIRARSAFGQNAAKEVKNYYETIIRPEYQTAQSAGAVYTAIRGRLKWWVDFGMEYAPRLYMLCWPASRQVTSQDATSEQYCFSPNVFDRLANALYMVALSQTSGVESDLGNGKLFELASHDANTTYLKEKAIPAAELDYAGNVVHAEKHYIITGAAGLPVGLPGNIFPHVHTQDIRRVTQGIPSRFTAISIKLHIPLSALKKFTDLRNTYANQVFLYQQEKTASVYAQRYKVLAINHQSASLVPEVTSLLGEPRLVSLFFQCLFSGCLNTEYDHADGKWYWTIGQVGDFDALRLSSQLSQRGFEGLYSSLTMFCMDLPHAGDLQLAPHHHFHPFNRQRFEEALAANIRANSLNYQQKQGFKDMLTNWHAPNNLIGSLQILYKCELEQPTQL